MEAKGQSSQQCTSRQSFLPNFCRTVDFEAAHNEENDALDTDELYAELVKDAFATADKCSALRLGTEWRLLSVEPGANRGNWDEMLRSLAVVATVADCFACDSLQQYRTGNHQQPCYFMFFKKNIPPSWEHPLNQHGGHWNIKVKGESALARADRLWTSLCHALCSGYFGNLQHFISGAAFRRKRNNLTVVKLKLWVQEGRGDGARTVQIRDKLMELWRAAFDLSTLMFTPHSPRSFQVHRAVLPANQLDKTYNKNPAFTTRQP